MMPGLPTLFQTPTNQSGAHPLFLIFRCHADRAQSVSGKRTAHGFNRHGTDREMGDDLVIDGRDRGYRERAVTSERINQIGFPGAIEGSFINPTNTGDVVGSLVAND